MNVRSMDLVVIQYQTARFRSPEEDAWRMLVSDLNACSGVRLIGTRGWERSAIVMAGAVGQRNQGKYATALESHPLLTHCIRAITYGYW